MSNVKRVGLPTSLRMRHDSHFIDQLGRAAGTPIGESVPIEDIDPNPNQPRQNVGDLSELIASIREKGVLEPILVRRRESRFQIVAGERRYRAAIEAGLPEMPCVIKDLSDPEVMEIALIENLQRKDLNAFEEAEGYRALGDLHGYTQEAIAKATGRSRSSVAESLTLLKVPKEVRERALDLGIEARSALLEIAKLKDAKAMTALLDRAAREGLSRDDLRRASRTAPERKTASGQRAKPYVFRFRSPDKSFQLQVNFRQATVDRDDLIRALEQILAEVRSADD